MFSANSLFSGRLTLTQKYGAEIYNMLIIRRFLSGNGFTGQLQIVVSVHMLTLLL